MPDLLTPGLTRLTLDPSCRVYLDGGRLILVTRELATVLSGTSTPELIAAGLALMDGSRSHQQIADQLVVPVPDWERVADRIAEAGLAWPAQAEDLHPRGMLNALVDSVVARCRPPSDPVGRTTTAALELAGGSTALAEEFARAWVDSGMAEPLRASAVDDPAPGVVLRVVTATDDHEVEDANTTALRTGRPWLLIEPYDGEMLTVGPVHLPGETCCAECTRIRRAANGPYSGPTRGSRVLVHPRMHTASLITRLQADLAALVAAVFVHRPDESAVGVVHALDLTTMRSSQHRVLRVPRCPACSPAGDRAVPYPWTRTVDVAG